MYLLICKKNDISAYIICIYSVSPLFLGYRNQLIQSVSRPDGGLLHPGTTTTHPWLSAETMSTRWQIPVKTSLMAPVKILSKDYENQTSPTHPFYQLHLLEWFFFKQKKLDEIFWMISIRNLPCDAAWNKSHHIHSFGQRRTGFLTEPGLVWVWVLCHCCLLSCLVKDS